MGVKTIRAAGEVAVGRFGQQAPRAAGRRAKSRTNDEWAIVNSEKLLQVVLDTIS